MPQTIYVVMRHQDGYPDVPVRAADTASVATMHAIAYENKPTATRLNVTYPIVPVELETAGDTRGH